jgi:hypothetical protein
MARLAARLPEVGAVAWALSCVTIAKDAAAAITADFNTLFRPLFRRAELKA